MQNSSIYKLSNDINYKEKEFSLKWRQLRACARCHRLKMRCSYDDPSYTSCKRCFAIGVKCSPDEDPTARYAKRKRRKKSNKSYDDDNVKISSQQYIESSKDVLKAIQLELKSGSPDLNTISNLCSDLQQKSTSISFVSEKHKLTINCNLMDEIISKHVITIEECKERFSMFIDNILRYYPIVSLSSKLKDFDYVYDNQPILLMSYIYATLMNDEGIYDTNGNIKEDNCLLSTLSNYIETSLSYRLFTNPEGFDFHLIYICLILSIWSLPPKNISNFKWRMPMLQAYNITLCMNLGDLSNYKSNDYNKKLLDDNSDERNELRAFLSVYSSFGTLSFGLSRFRVLNWSANHEAAIDALMKNCNELPTRHDKYLCYISQIVKIGLEILQFVSPVSISPPSIRDDNLRTCINGEPKPNLRLVQARNILSNYEKKICDIAIESGFINPLQDFSQDKYHEILMEGYTLYIIYYHLLMIIYDSLINNYLSYKRFDFGGKDIDTKSEGEREAFIESIIKLNTTCGKLVNSFLEMSTDQSIVYPGYLIYRPLHAIILMVRLKLLINSQTLNEEKKYFKPGDLDINVEVYYDLISKFVKDKNKKFNSAARSKMNILLNKISKWMKHSNINENKEKMNPLVINLIDMNRDQEIEKLGLPKEDNDVASPKIIQPSDVIHSPKHVEDISMQGNQGMQNFEFSSFDNFPMDNIFNDINSEILNFLTPWDSNPTFDSFLDELKDYTVEK